MECKLDNITIHYEITGEGRPLLMLHGRPVDHHYMAADMEPIFAQREGWKRIYPDLPGMGQTPGVNWITTEDQVLDVVLGFIDKVIPGQRFSVAGSSYGGYLARGVVYRRAASIDGLLLIVPVIELEFAKRAVPSHVSIVEDSAIFAEADPKWAEGFREFAVVQSKKLLEYMRANVFPAMERADETFLDTLRAHPAFSFDVDKLPQPFTKPTLILTARQDSDAGYKDSWRILENYPRGTFVVLDRAGHVLAVEQEHIFQTMVNEWLDRVEEGSQAQN